MRRKIIGIGILVMVAVGLAATGVFAQDGPGLAPNTKAPDFVAVTYDGAPVKLSDIYSKGPVVLIFYRGSWCPYCNMHLRSFQQKADDIRALGAKIIAVSVDKPETTAELADEQGYDFIMVSNPDADILKMYDVIYKVPDELADKYKNEYGIDLEAASGRTDHIIAVPATYVIDSTGMIVFAYANEDYKMRTQPDEVIAVLEELTGRGGSDEERE